MKMSNPTRSTRETFSDAPPGEWFDLLLQRINQSDEEKTQALQGNLTIADNMNAAIVTYRMTHGTERTIKNPLKGRPTTIRAGRSSAVNGGTRYRVDTIDWRFIDSPDPTAPQQIGLKAFFALDNTKAFLALRKSANQNITTATVTATTWDTTAESIGSVVSVASNSKITVTEAGVYSFTAHVCWTADAGGHRWAWFSKNGTHSAAGARRGQSLALPFATDNPTYTVSSQWLLAAGDYVELYVYHTSATTPLAILGNATDECALQVSRLYSNESPQNDVTFVIEGG